MTILEKIRSKAGLLVTVIGVALLVFIVQSALESGNFLFLNNEMKVGEINGNAIDYQDFNTRVEIATEEFKKNSGQTTVNDAMQNMIVQQTWDRMVDELVIKKEYEELGLSVSDQELFDLMRVNPHYYVMQNLMDRETGRVHENLATPTGELDLNKLNQFVDNMTPEVDQQFWQPLEKAVKEMRIADKYNMLAKKGLYVTKSQARHDFLASEKTFNISYILKPYSSLPDNEVKISEEDILDYYNAHRHEYRQEDSRKIEYVSFDINPSAEDFQEVKEEMEKIAGEFRNLKSFSEDSLFVIAESDTRTADETFYKKGELEKAGKLSGETDSLLFSSDSVSVYGPYLQGNFYKVAKLSEKKDMPDSVKTSHILISYKGAERANPNLTRTREQSKLLADSLFKIVKENSGRFTEFARNYSDDVVAASKDGDIGWFGRNSGMDERFKQASFRGAKDEMVLTEGNFGFHIIHITDRKDIFPNVRVSIVEREVKPGKKTLETAYAKAVDFSGKSTTPELFEKTIAEKGLNKGVPDPLKPGDNAVQGLPDSKELVRWAFRSEPGAISQPMEAGSKFIVALLKEVREKGIAPFEQVKAQVEVKAREEKKAQTFTEELEKIMNGAKSIDEIASKISLPVEKFENLSFNSSYIGNLGREEAVTGTIVTLKQGDISKPIQGTSGVFIVKAESIRNPAETKDYSLQRSTAERALQSRTDFEAFNALKENADIQDNRIKFY